MSSNVGALVGLQAATNATVAAATIAATAVESDGSNIDIECIQQRIKDVSQDADSAAMLSMPTFPPSTKPPWKMQPTKTALNIAPPFKGPPNPPCPDIVALPMKLLKRSLPISELMHPPPQKTRLATPSPSSGSSSSVRVETEQHGETQHVDTQQSLNREEHDEQHHVGRTGEARWPQIWQPWREET